MEEKILLINIDMGMNYNGIYYVCLEKSSEDKYDIKDKSAIITNHIISQLSLETPTQCSMVSKPL